MGHWIRLSGPSWIFFSGLSSILLTILTSGQSHPDSPSIQVKQCVINTLHHIFYTTASVGHHKETVRHNVTVFKAHENTTIQIKVDIGFRKGQVEVNGFPVNRGVTRITRGMEIIIINRCFHVLASVGDIYVSGIPGLPKYYGYKGFLTLPKTCSSDRLGPHIGSVSIRFLVQEWPLNFTSREIRILVQQEVVSFDGYRVQQNRTTQMELLVNDSMDLVTYSTSNIPLEETLLYSIPQANDVLFTFPNIPETGDRAPQQTTREYNLRQNTTLDEEPYPGKLPETPIRGEVPASSYKVMCQYAEYLRENLCYMWSRCYPVLIEIVKVIVVGVIAAAIVIEVLKIIYPVGEKKGVLEPMDFKDSPVLVPLISQETDSLINACDDKDLP